jgi:hypothetical protein
MGTHLGKSFDLVISTTSDRYQPPAGYQQYNGVYDYFGYIAMRLESAMDVKFSIVETGTNDLMVLPKFFFSFFDLDTGVETGDQSGAAERVKIKGFEQYFVGNETELHIGKDEATGQTTFTATRYGESHDNPDNPYNMTQLQQNRALSFMFVNTAEFEVTYELNPGGTSLGREVYFAGASQLARQLCSPVPSAPAAPGVQESKRGVDPLNPAGRDTNPPPAYFN